ncbi:hypothetical protein [Streptomyces sp. NPDC057580]|uniref:hypothetical protein n=1 Tax=Streptomyces sp. NPDC057580 TaxID=3346173 RepID=UPI0036C55D9D
MITAREKRRRANGQATTNWPAAKAVTSCHGTAPSATAWWPRAASTLPTSANSPARTHATARSGPGRPSGPSYAVT